MRNKRIIVALVATVGVAPAALAWESAAPNLGAFINCTAETLGTVDGLGSPASDFCTQMAGVSQDNTQAPLVVNNSGGFFGRSDWGFHQKWEDGNLNQGIVAPSTSFSEALIVFKGPTASNLAGFLLTPPEVLTWNSSPLYVLGRRGLVARDVSHVSLYVRTPIEAPMAASAPILGLLLGGLAVLRRRLRRA